MSDQDTITQLELQVSELKDECARLSTDAVTGAHGRSVFEKELEIEFARTKRFGRSLGVLMVDVDDFKRVNDKHGHTVGDEVLRDVAGSIKSVVRNSDIFARYGGEEFVVLVDSATAEGLIVFSDRVRRSVDVSTMVTVSIGTALVRAIDSRPWDAVDRADAAMYQAKQAGKNRCAHG